MAEVREFETKAEAYAAVSSEHGVDVADIDIIPHPRLEASYLSYGPDDEDVELVSWARE